MKREFSRQNLYQCGLASKNVATGEPRAISALLRRRVRRVCLSRDAHFHSDCCNWLSAILPPPDAPSLRHGTHTRLFITNCRQAPLLLSSLMTAAAAKTLTAARDWASRWRAIGSAPATARGRGSTFTSQWSSYRTVRLSASTRSCSRSCAASQRQNSASSSTSCLRMRRRNRPRRGAQDILHVHF